MGGKEAVIMLQFGQGWPQCDSDIWANLKRCGNWQSEYLREEHSSQCKCPKIRMYLALPRSIKETPVNWAEWEMRKILVLVLFSVIWGTPVGFWTEESHDLIHMFKNIAEEGWKQRTVRRVWQWSRQSWWGIRSGTWWWREVVRF